MADGISIVWTGFEALEAKLTEIAQKADAISRDLVVKSAALVTAAAQKNFEGSHKRGSPHTGGNKPNVVTGYLRRSITMTTPVRTGVSSYVAKVGPTAIYGRAVELGLHSGARAYPYFRPAVKSVTPKLAALQVEAYRNLFS